MAKRQYYYPGFQKLPIRGILQDMLDKMNFSSTMSLLLFQKVGLLLYRGRAMNTRPFSISVCFAPSMVWILEKLDSLLPQVD